MLLPYASHASKLSSWVLPKTMEKKYLKRQHKESYQLKNSYRSLSLSNIGGKIYERIILEQARNILPKPLVENNSFKRENLYYYYSFNTKLEKYFVRGLLRD